MELSAKDLWLSFSSHSTWVSDNHGVDTAVETEKLGREPEHSVSTPALLGESKECPSTLPPAAIPSSATSSWTTVDKLPSHSLSYQKMNISSYVHLQNGRKRQWCLRQRCFLGEIKILVLKWLLKLFKMYIIYAEGKKCKIVTTLSPVTNWKDSFDHQYPDHEIAWPWDSEPVGCAGHLGKEKTEPLYFGQ